MNMRTEIAKSIYEDRNGAGCKAWGSLTNAHKGPYLDDADAALKALQNPTIPMCMVHEDKKWDDWTAYDLFVTMIEAADKDD